MKKFGPKAVGQRPLILGLRPFGTEAVGLRPLGLRPIRMGEA